MSDNLSLPYKIPSLGKLYDGKVPEGQTTILPIRGEHEELLAMAAESEGDALSILQQVSRQLVQLPADFDFPNLLVSDWMALMLNIFGFSYSSVISLNPQCPRCKESFVQTTDLGSLECTTAEGFGDEYKEPFICPPLPKSGDRVTYRLLRLHDLNRIEDYASQHKSKGLSDPTHTFSLATQIISINDEASLTDLHIMQWIRKALSFDLRFLRQEMTKWETGYDLTPNFKCTKCKTDFRVRLPLDFFRSIGPQP